jgi:hypothetical protein
LNRLADTPVLLPARPDTAAYAFYSRFIYNGFRPAILFLKPLVPEKDAPGVMKPDEPIPAFLRDREQEGMRARV